MRTSLLHASLAAFVLAVSSSTAVAQPVTTAFTYQGELMSNGAPLTGTVDLRFRLFSSAGGILPIGPVLCADNVGIVDGKFTLSLDFGDQFTGSQRFLEVAVRADAGPTCATLSGFTILTPRQSLTATPHASFALNTGLLDGVPAGDFARRGFANTFTSSNRFNAPVSINSAPAAGTQLTVNASVGTSLLATTTGTAIPLLVDANNSGSLAMVAQNGNVVFTDDLGVGATTPLTRLHVRENAIGSLTNAIGPDIVVVEASDAYLGLYSFDSGTFGSGISLKEMNNNALVNTWNIARESTTGGNDLHFLFGTSNTPGGNNARMSLSSTGDLAIDGSLLTGGGVTTDSVTVGSDLQGTPDGLIDCVRGPTTSNFPSLGIPAISGRSNQVGIGMGVAAIGLGDDNGLQAYSELRNAIEATANDANGSAIRAFSTNGLAIEAFGDLVASGTKSFRIDHPEDPENSYLLHYCLEAPQPLNIYSGIAELDEHGEAWITMPSYFAKINRSPRYSQTAMGQPMPMLHIAEEIRAASLEQESECMFKVAGGAPLGRVSWEVKADRWDTRVRAKGAPVVVPKRKEVER